VTRSALRTGLALGAVCAAAAVAYIPSFAVPFQFDDYARLGDHPSLQRGGVFAALPWLGASRVVPGLTLVLNYRLGGFDPFGFHVLNFAVHLLATLAVFALALTLCRTPRLRARWSPERALPLATAAAFLFACHPLQTQAVTYIVQRYASIAALFYLWAVVCYARARNRQVGAEVGSSLPFMIAAGVCAVCAVLSKEHAVTLPVSLLLVEWIGYGWPRRRSVAIGALLACVLFAVPVMWTAAVSRPTAGGAQSRLAHLRHSVGSMLRPGQTSAGATPALVYLRTQAVVVPGYLRLVVLPWGQNVDHDVPLARSLGAPVVAGGVLLALLAAFGVSQVRRRPLLGFAILWCFITLSVESSVIGLPDVMVEHRMYLPMAGVALGLAALFVAAVQRAPRLAPAAGLLVAAGLVALTFARNVVWLSPVTLWLDAAEKSPAKARPHTNAGMAYHTTDRFEEAIDHYCRALALEPGDDVARANLEVARYSLGEDPIDAGAADVTAYCPEEPQMNTDEHR
jgi:hypothetical protein